MFIGIEAVHLTANILDTNDIRTIRGCSMAIENLGPELQKALGVFSPELLVYGGSRVVAKCKGDRAELEAALSKFCESAPQSYLSLRWGVRDDAKSARRVGKEQLYQGWTVKPTPPFDGLMHDELDEFRPAIDEEYGPSGKLRYLSPRSSAFRKIGARSRPFFDLAPPKDFHEIVEDPPEAVALPAKTKIAVVYADGSGFGKLHGNVSPSTSAFLADKRAQLGAKLSNWIKDGGHYTMIGSESDKPRSRFEILMWGGDDMTFIMPAWLIFDFFRVFFEEVETWGEQEAVAIHHRAAAVIANFKTPIRLLRNLAASGQTLLKQAFDHDDAGTSCFSIDTFESMAPPFDNLLSSRTGLFGKDYSPKSDVFLPKDARDFPSYLLSMIGEKEANKISRSALHKVLERLLAENLSLSEPAAQDRAAELLLDYRDRTGGDFNPKHHLAQRSLPIHLARIAELAPYVEHFREDLHD